MSIKLSIHHEDWIAIVPFRVANNLWETFAALVVELQDGDIVGRGEAEGVYYFDETPQAMAAQVRNVAAQIEAGASRVDLLELLPPGGARNAVDAALWDLEAKRTGKRVWELAGLTHGLEMAREAKRRGLGLMVGNMGGTSLSMAPSFVIGLLCDFHDLDGPLLLENDRPFGLTYTDGVVSPPSVRLWG